MSATALFLVSASVRAMVLLLVALAVTRALASRSAAIRHAVWAAALTGALILPLAMVAAPRDARLRVDAGAVWTRLAQLVNDGQHATARPPRPLPFVDDGPDGVVTRAPVTHAPRGLPTLDDAAATLLALWLIGAVVGLAGTLVGFIGAARVAHRARAAPASWLARLGGELAPQHGEPMPVVRVSDELAAPATIGVLRAVIVLPADAMHWPPEFARCVLAHELAHVNRRDCLTHLLARVARAVYWFNPLAWVAVHRMGVEREQACDDQALATGVSRHRYATVLVEIARSVRGAPPAGALAMAVPSELEVRVRAVLDGRPSRATTGHAARLAIAATAFVALATVPSLEAAQGTAVQGRPREPDTRGDSVAGPLSERLAATDLREAVRASSAAAIGPDSALVRMLRAALARTPTWTGDLVRERAAWALTRARDGRLVEPLIESLGHADWRVRAYAAWALAHSDDARSVGPLVAQLGHPVWRLRAMAAHALAELGDPRARLAMEPLFADEAWQVRASVVRYLSAFDDPAARAHVQRARSDAHVMVRTAADRARE